MNASPSDGSQPSSMSGVAPPGLGNNKLTIEQMFQQIVAQGNGTKKSVAKVLLFNGSGCNFSSFLGVFISRTHPSREAMFFGQRMPKKKARHCHKRDVFEP